MKITSMVNSRKAIGRGAVVGIVIVIIIVAAVGVYALTTMSPSTSTTTTSSATSSNTSTSSVVSTSSASQSTGPTTSLSSTSASTTSGASSSSTSSSSSSSSSSVSGGITLSPKNSSELVDESNPTSIDSMDPGNGFFQQDQSYLNAVFQDLASFNGSDTAHLVPVIASSWTTTNNSEQYIFTIRPDVYFSNGDNITAYTVWFNYVRELYMNAPSAIGYSNFNLITMNSTDWFSKTCGNFEPWGLVNALSSVQGTALTKANCKTLSSAVNSMLSSFNPSDATQQKIMSYPHQAYVVVNATTFVVNTLKPYALFVNDIAGFSGSHLADPAFVDAHGGVANNTQNSYLNTNCEPGSGPYICKSVASGLSEIVFVKNTHYWAAGSGPNGLKQGLPRIIQPAHIAVIDAKYGVTGTPLYEDFGTNVAALSAAGIPEWSQFYSAYQQKSHVKFSQILDDVGPSDFVFYIAQNSQRFPTNITAFRQAFRDAFNYTQAFQNQVVFNGTAYGDNILGPATPGYGSLYNPAKLPLPSQNITKATQEIKAAGMAGHFYVVLPNGTTVGDTKGTQLAPLSLTYISPLSPSQQALYTIIQQSLAQIGVATALVGETSAVYNLQAQSPTTAPVFTSLGWGIDYNDPWLQQYVCFYTTACNLPTYIDNSTLTNLVQSAAFNTNASAQLQADQNLYQIGYDQSWYVWLPWPHTTLFVQPYLKGVENDLFVGLYWNLMYYQPATV